MTTLYAKLWIFGAPHSGKPHHPMSESGPGCSLTWGLNVKLSLDAPAGFTVLSAVGAVPSA